MLKGNKAIVTGASRGIGFAIAKRAEIGSDRVAEKAEQTQSAEYKSNLKVLSQALLKVPANPAESFYEAVLCLYFCYSFIPDSIGLIDRYLYPFYKKDIESGILTDYKRSDDILKATCFEELYGIYEQELFSDLWSAEKISAGFQKIRGRDRNPVSNIFLEGCIENAKSCTQGGLTRYIAVGLLIGLPNVIDSLAVTKQLVFDEKIITLRELIEALKNNWSGFEGLRALILKKGCFFGNDDDLSNGIAKQVLHSVAKRNNTENYLEKKWLFGNLIGYNEHHKFFGNGLKATPDGRFDGDIIKFGIGQSDGKDRNGLTALLNSVAKCDPDAVLTGPGVTNIFVDEQLIENDDNFEKTVPLLETYFKNGGTHFQLNYVSREDLINAKKTPANYKSLRVRVSGFSDYFVFLNDALQDEIITRTKHAR